MTYNELETKTIVTRAEVALVETDIRELRWCHEMVGQMNGHLATALYVLLGAILGQSEDTLEDVRKSITRELAQ